MRMKASDYSCIPLCVDCHQMAPGAYHRKGRPAFEAQTGVNCRKLADRLYEEWKETR